MPNLSKVAEKNFEQLLVLVNQARARNRKMLYAAVKAGDTKTRDEHIKIEKKLQAHHIEVIELQQKYEASDTAPSTAEKALKSLVANTRKQVQKVNSIASALNGLEKVASLITKFVGVL